MTKNPVPRPDGAHCAVAFTFDVDAGSILHLARVEALASAGEREALFRRLLVRPGPIPELGVALPDLAR